MAPIIGGVAGSLTLAHSMNQKPCRWARYQQQIGKQSYRPFNNNPETSSLSSNFSNSRGSINGSCTNLNKNPSYSHGSCSNLTKNANYSTGSCSNINKTVTSNGYSHSVNKTATSNGYSHSVNNNNSVTNNSLDTSACNSNLVISAPVTGGVTGRDKSVQSVISIHSVNHSPQRCSSPHAFLQSFLAKLKQC